MTGEAGPDTVTRQCKAVQRHADGLEARVAERTAALEVGLPNADGWELLRRLRADARTRGLPVVALTE